MKPAVASVCDDRITYSARKLRLLSREEIQHSLEDLLSIDFDVRSDLPDDISIHGYENNIAAVVTEVHADSYFTVAERIAAWARSRNFEGVVNCAGLQAAQCAERFNNEFLPKIYRRPPTEKEMLRMATMFNPTYTDGDIASGIELAMVAALTSVNFLYRSEMGQPLSQGEYDGTQYEAINLDSATRTTAAQFGRKDNGILDPDGGWTLRSITSQLSLIEQHVAFPQGGGLVTLEIRGEPRGGVYPELMVQIPEHTFYRTIENEDYEDLKIYFPEASGHQPIHIRLNNAPSQDGDGARIMIRNVTISEGRLPAEVADEDAYRLSAFELASFLSYTYTGSTPDQTLLEAAANGILETDQQIFDQAYRLLGTPRGRQQMGAFAEQWLGVKELKSIAKDPAKYPQLTADVKDAMAEELRQFFAHIALDDDARFEDFFTADYTFANDLLANYYGLTSPGSSEFAKVGAGERGGVLTTGAFLSVYGNPDETSPIRRAVNVRKRLLCQSVPPPPPGIAIDRDAAEKEMGDAWINGEITNRTRYDSLTKAQYCAACHKEVINPLGFGLEDFNTVGLKRNTDLNGLGIDASGYLTGLASLADGQTVSFHGAKDLSKTLADVESTKACVVENAFRFVTGSGAEIIDELNPKLGALDSEEIADNSCTVNDLTTKLSESHDLRTVFANLGTLKMIRYRKEKNR